MIHAIKIDPLYFETTAAGIKNFEIRKNDRQYRPGDFIALNEWKDGKYTGRCMLHRITIVVSSKEYCKEGYVVIGIVPYSVSEITYGEKRAIARIYDREVLG